jgi:hypothetical protein
VIGPCLDGTGLHFGIAGGIALDQSHPAPSQCLSLFARRIFAERGLRGFPDLVGNSLCSRPEEHTIHEKKV